MYPAFFCLVSTSGDYLGTNLQKLGMVSEAITQAA
ncbi:hypothetical protein THPR109532_16725 [Thalassospira profundimaris]